MASSPVHPLRIQKGTPSNSPNKMLNGTPRALTELAPTEKRRNSPSFNQTTKKMILKEDSSPFQSSPFNVSDANSSPRLFWQGRDPATPSRFNAENGGFISQRETSPSPTRRSSIEKLQRASRVKNSNMFAREQKQEYDPTHIPVIERPLAKQVQGNAYGGSGLGGLRNEERSSPAPWSPSHKYSDSKSGLPLYSPLSKTPLVTSTANTLEGRSPSKDQLSPTKSSLSQRHFNPKASFDSENGVWTDEQSGDERQLPEGRILHRHAKSVTFDAAPPQINEYEMTTPDLSSIGTGSRENSYDSAEEDEEELYNIDNSIEHDDSFDASLEDTDKTPVVGPDEWRHASPQTHQGLSNRFEDPFNGPEGSPMPDVMPSSPTVTRPLASRVDSNGDHRPLPPLPGAMDSRHSRSGSSNSIGLSAAAERASSSQRGLPSPPKAAITSKSEIQGMGGGKMTLEERLHLMMIQDDNPKTAAEEQRERRMRRAGARGSATPERAIGEIKIHEDEVDEDEDTLGDLGDYQLPARPSRESILRKVDGQDNVGRESIGYDFSSPPPSSPERAVLDPDVPLPSTEESIIGAEEQKENEHNEPMIKAEEEDEVDVYAITEMYQRTSGSVDDGYSVTEEYYRAESRQENRESIIGSMIENDLREGEDADSQYSDPTPTNQSPEPQKSSSVDEDGPPTPRTNSPIGHETGLEVPQRDTKSLSLPLPEFAGNFMGKDDFGLGLEDYMTPSPPPAVESKDVASAASSITPPEQFVAPQRPSTPPPKTKPAPISLPEYDGTGWGSDDEFDEGTPGSVIHHHIPDSPARDSPEIPEQVATIKGTSGSRLRTRPSNTPADLMAMREARRQISGEVHSIPPIPQRHRNRPSLNLDRSQSDLGPDASFQDELPERKPSFKRSLTLDIDSDTGLGLDKDFDRVIESQKVVSTLSSSHPDFPLLGPGPASGTLSYASQASTQNANHIPRKQRGYLMRQNTKLVVASSDVDKSPDHMRGSRSVGNSPVKGQNDRPESWVVEPWNGSRRKSIRSENSSTKKKIANGPVPPLPGQESNAQALSSLTEEEPLPENSSSEGERGRLFVKVIGVKDLDLPLPKNERSWFSLTLDNGVHCVTTAWLELGKNAPIGQEFELVVPSDLEFQLTLNAKLERPAPKRVVESPTKMVSSKKTSTFSRVFASPKKRKELEMRSREEESRVAQEEVNRQAQLKRMTQPTTWDLLSPLAAEDGSFGRSYVCLKDHESRCYGRPYVVDVACFNEWATEEANSTSSVKSKRGNTHVQRRAPYKVGKLELQLLFVPKPKGAKDGDMPKSMNSCIRQMKEAELAMARAFEGHLSQQGGDCPYWRRRFFKLNRSKLTAYHESTGQPRATINLANASKLIDDRRSLTQKETTGKGGSRRKSGFAEEEEGYMFVEEGFRIRFANGEVIDFYADSAADKDGWMRVLDQCIGKDAGESKSGKWCDVVLRREESMMRKKASGQSGDRGRKVSGKSAHARSRSMIA